MKIHILLILSFSILISSSAFSQDDLMNLLEANTKKTIHFTEATFKGSRLINGHTVETRKQGELEFLISHRFGRLNSGAYEFFGLDAANVRLGLEYGVANFLTLGVGRNSFEKTYDGFAKLKLLRQSSGKRVMPFSVVSFSSAAIKTLKGSTPEEYPDIAARMYYVQQLLIARKFGSALSLQIMPSFVHRNRIQEREGENDIYALGFGGRIKLTQRVSLNGEYYYRINAEDYDEGDRNQLFNSLAIGFDIETGGHVFQLHLTNSRSMIEKGFIAETNGNFFAGDIHFGFNVSRVF